MSTKKPFVLRAEAGKGWRIWNRRMKKGWGGWFTVQPTELFDELNGLRRQDVITKIIQQHQKNKETA